MIKEFEKLISESKDTLMSMIGFSPRFDLNAWEKEIDDDSIETLDHLSYEHAFEDYEAFILSYNLDNEATLWELYKYIERADAVDFF